jgi:hypothetical protein
MTDTPDRTERRRAPQSAVVAGFNHVATVTHDLDLLVRFPAQLLDVPLVEGP